MRIRLKESPEITELKQQSIIKIKANSSLQRKVIISMPSAPSWHTEKLLEAKHKLEKAEHPFQVRQKTMLWNGQCIINIDVSSKQSIVKDAESYLSAQKLANTFTALST